MFHIRRIFSCLALALTAVALVAPVSAGESLDMKLVQSHCAACHTFGKSEPHGQGPNLYGLIGRKAASASGYTYSSAIAKALGGRVWTPELLDAWLADTQAVAPGTGMTYFQDDQPTRSHLVKYFENLR
ncbi:c-type cytochrome [Aromatoleum toluclasticum]|uniref:c-type cytochrome n=1 Tax=Aromatoleum toluclasticum TaxID=92003 RepID=UPI001D189A92|nr:c-type cytochrome [Aromatoleum toluclasticum]MCC4118464.1 c-type cytochrome [Aromatoleum toluclasticum]